jgi:hypothetical protein
MATSPKLLAAACAFAFAAAGLCAPASAASDHEAHPKAVKVLKEKEKEKSKAKGKHAKAKKEAVTDDVMADTEPEPDITDTVVVDYACELNNKVTIYKNDTDDAHIALRWKNRLQRLERIGTTTGALRFENPRTGLIWIGIPAKGILLDAKMNRQLANECKNAEQTSPVVATIPAEKKS